MPRSLSMQLGLGVLVLAVALASAGLLLKRTLVPPNPAQAGAVWCFDVVKDADGGRQVFGHPASVVPPDIAASAGAGASFVEQHCFDKWKDAAAYITDGKVQLPDDATEDDYVREVGRPLPTPATSAP